MNFGETLAFWYLRLNGFFPIQDFVLHHDPETIEHSSDTDLLAIRLPHVYEVVGGQVMDWDNKFEQWGINLSTMKVGLIVEVKTGKNNAEYRRNITESFNRKKLIYGIQRLGFWPYDQVAALAEELHTKSVYVTPQKNILIGKLLIAINIPQEVQIPPCLQLKLAEAEAFILRRFNNYKAQKNSDRLKFPSDLIQYMIWRQGIDRN